MPSVALRRGTLLLAALLCLAGRSSDAATGNFYLFTSLNAGSNPLYLTWTGVAGAPVQLQKDLSSNFIVNVQQHWVFDSNFPTNFRFGSLANNGATYYLTYSSTGALSLNTSSGANPLSQLWSYLSDGRLVSNDGNFFLNVNTSSNGYTTSKTALFLTPKSVAPAVSQQFQAVYDLTASLKVANFFGSLYSLASFAPNQKCIDSGLPSSLVPGLPNSPALTACSGSAPGQNIEILQSNQVIDPPNLSQNLIAFYPSMFRIRLSETGLCLGVVPSLLNGQQSTPNNLVQLDCDGSWAETNWFLTSKGQFQSFLLSTNSNPFCLAFSGGSAVIASCSFTTLSNRFLLY